jgi:hypothetical protein
MTVYEADAHVQVQRQVLVFKMATALEECITEEQRFLLASFCGQKDLM